MEDELLELMVRYMNHIPEGTDHSLIVLKGHLICEEQLYRCLTNVVALPKYIESANFKFSQLLEVTKAHYFKQEDSWLWGSLHKLNKIRNMLSHNLEPNNFENELNQLVELIEQNVPGEENETYELRVRYSLAMVAGKVHELEALVNA